MRQSALRIFLLLTLLLLTACGGGEGTQNTGGIKDGPSAQEPPVSAGDPQQPAESQSARPDAEPSPSLFGQMPPYYSFSSGAGAWSTDIQLSGDGSFTGGYHDSDMGDLDEALYPYGTMYYCNFSGQFSQPEKVDEHTYTMRLESLTAEGTEGTEEVEEGIRHIVSVPYGLERAEEVRILLPGTPVDSLPEELLFWLLPHIYTDMPEELPFYVLYNVAEEYAFVGYEG